MSKEKRNSCMLGLLAMAALTGLDQFTKYLAASHLKNGNAVILIKDVFQLHYLENRGAAFGLFQGGKIWFVAITLLVVIGMSYIYVRCPMEKKFRWVRGIIVCLMAGAFGNLIDRMALDYVIDFFYFELINFPVFNVADIYVSCGMAMLLILFLFYYKEEDMEVLLPSRKKKDGKS